MSNISFFTHDLNTEAATEIHYLASELSQWGRGASVLITSRWRGAVSKHASHLLYSLNPSSVTFPSDLSFAFLLATYETFLQ